MATVEHWWNGSWGWLFRRDLWLEHDGDGWHVRVRWGRRDTRLHYDTEVAARAELALLLSQRGPWQRLTE